MLCLPEITKASDVPYWVSKKAFYAFFDQEDFLYREEQSVTSAYLENWFIESEVGVARFLLPTVGAVGMTTQFINGRHRVAVLLPYLKELPIAFTFACCMQFCT